MRGSRESVTIRNEDPRRQRRTVDRHDALNALGGLRLHWLEYLMEAGELALYMFFACAFATLLRHPASPIPHVIVSDLIRRALYGRNWPRVGLSEKEAKAQGIEYRLFKVPMEADSDRLLGFTAFGVGAGEIMASVQIAMIAVLPYTALRDAVLTHPTLVEGLAALFTSELAQFQNATRVGGEPALTPMFSGFCV
jgi:hypothetical protein